MILEFAYLSILSMFSKIIIATQHSKGNFQIIFEFFKSYFHQMQYRLKKIK